MITFWWISFLVVGVVLGILGFGSLVTSGLMALKGLSVVFLAAFVVLLIVDLVRRHRMHGQQPPREIPQAH